ncbi:hypothetical protein B0H34DRAFT_797532 [Crassisporium funariophilum]|nr:hypothetical protein B0H34DRAFT_797532 [Crassisporium funariophilum]
MPTPYYATEGVPKSLIHSGECFRFSAIFQAVQEEVKKLPELRKLRVSTLYQRLFSIDLTLVALSLRTGYLLDLFSPQDAVSLFSRLLAALCANPQTKNEFVSVFHIYEPVSGQSFFVNRTLLLRRIPGLSSLEQEPSDDSPSFVRLDWEVGLLDALPPSILHHLDAIFSFANINITDHPRSFSLPEDTTFEQAVPLAAVLLDYIVAYVPTSLHLDMLSGIPLDFYECILTFRGSSDHGKVEQQDINHVVMKFSCPAAIREGGVTQLDPGTITRRLENIFGERLKDIGDSTASVAIMHVCKTVERVTF